MKCHAGSPSCESTQDFDLELAPFGQEFLIWLCGHMMINRWDKMCKQIIRCSLCVNGHLLLVAEEAKIEYAQ